MLGTNPLGDWEQIDLLKVICAIAAGFILGAEREFKDKSAGLKTIATICLGSTLFTILSFKLGVFENTSTTQIAAYVVSGIGFLGAGVIFKDGFNIGGLTTASISWISAAIGMAIGFGEFYLALTFLASSILILLLGNLLNKYFFSIRSNYSIIFKLPIEHVDTLQTLEQELSGIAKHIDQKKIEKTSDSMEFHYDIFINKTAKETLLNILNSNKHISSYSIQ